MTKLLISTGVPFSGGPHVWRGRFTEELIGRGYQVTDNPKSDWSAALFINRPEGLAEALNRQKPVAYRVANGFMPEWFSAMNRQMQPSHHAANASISRALETAPNVIYQSKWAKSVLDAYLFERQDNYAVILNGVDLNQFIPARKPPSYIPVIGTVGRLRYRYRLETFFKMSLQIEVPHRLVIIGSMDMECKAVYKKYMTKPEIRSRTTYWGQISPERLPELYQLMHVLVHPVCGDVCPNVAIEAMACGVPVVAPHYGGTSEIIGNGGVIFDCEPWRYDEIFVVSMSAAVKKCLKSTGLYSDRARQVAEQHFDLQSMVDRYLEVLGLPSKLSFNSPTNKSKEQRLSFRNRASRWVNRPRYLVASTMRSAMRLRHRLTKPRPNRNPRIAFTLYDFHVGGIENWLYRLAKELRDEFDFHFLATRVPIALSKFHSVGSFAFLPAPGQMIQYLQKHRIDIVQAHNERWPVDAALAAGVAHVIERTDGTRSCTQVPKYGLSLVIASSKGTIPMIAEHFPPEKIALVYNGVDLEEMNQAPTNRLWGPEAFVIGRTSRFGRGKNIPMLIEAVAKLLPDYPQIKLLLIGGDSPLPGAEPMEIELRELASHLGDSVLFPGSIEDPVPLIKGLDVGTCVSNPDNEGIPNSLIEAMACSKPVISTFVDQVDELVQDGHNGLLIPPGDVDALVVAVRNLIDDPVLRQRLGEAGRRTVEKNYSLAHSARKYAEIYYSLMENRV